VWNETGATLSFVLEPFFWQRWWFSSLTGALLLGLLAWGIRAYERGKIRLRMQFLERRHAVDRERARIARDIHDELGAGLAQIGLLADLGVSQTGEPAPHSHFVKVAHRAREAVSALDEIVWAANPRNDNLPRLADYLCNLAEDCFESGPSRCRKEIPSDLPNLPVRAEVRHHLALAVKEALANALKHSGASTVWLRLKWAEPDLEISVEDNGAGFTQETSGSGRSGLRNQAGRMRDIGGSVQIQSAPGRGTVVRFQLRLEPDGREKAVARWPGFD